MCVLCGVCVVSVCCVFVYVGGLVGGVCICMGVCGGGWVWVN